MIIDKLHKWKWILMFCMMVIGISFTYTANAQVLTTKEERKKAKQELKEKRKALIAVSKEESEEKVELSKEESKDSLTVLDLIQMPLEELMTMEIVKRSQSEKNLKIPISNLQIISENDIISNGFYSLTDVLKSITSYTVIDDGYQLTGAQRGLSGNFSQTLILVDGRELNSLLSYEAYLSHQFATHNIKRIEITQGPASVFYGSNSYSGIVNIVTKDFKGENTSVQAQMDVGTENTQSIAVVVGKNYGDFHLGGSFNYRHTRHYDHADFVSDSSEFSPGFHKFANGIFYNDNQYQNKNRAFSYAINGSYKDLYFGRYAISNYSGQKGLQNVSLDYLNANSERRDYSVSFIGYRFDLGDNNSVNFEYQFSKEKIWGSERNVFAKQTLFDSTVVGRLNPLTVNEINSQFTRYYSQENSSGSKRHRVRFQLDSELPIKTRSELFKGSIFFNFGFTFDNYDVLGFALSNNNPAPPFNSSISNGNPLRLPFYRYTQIDAFLQTRKSIINEQLFLSFAGRYSFNINYGGDFQIRAGLIANFLENTYFKLYYGKDRREPSIGETISITENNEYQFNGDLKPASIHSLEMGFSHRFNKHAYMDLSAYALQAGNYIYTSGAYSWMNDDERRRSIGVEGRFDFNYDKVDGWTQYSFTYANENLNYYPHRAVLSLSYDPFEYLRLNALINYYSKIRTVHGHPGLDESFTISPHATLNLTVSTKEIFYEGFRFTAMATLENIFNTQQYTPNIMRSGPKQFRTTGRKFMLRLIFDL